MKNKAYVGIGSVSMGIMGSFCNPQFFQDYLASARVGRYD